MNTLNRKDLIILALLTLMWGINWPVMKMGMQAFPPWLFRVITLAIGFATLFAFLRFSGKSWRVPRAQWGLVIWLALPNMVIWHLVSAYAVRNLSSGRAAILGYTMPIWVVLLTVFLYKQPLTRRHLFASLAMTLGIIALLWDEAAQLAGKPLWASAAIFCAAMWAYGTIAVKRSAAQISPLSLALWMMPVAIAANALATLSFEIPAWRTPLREEWLAIFYTGVVAMGFAQTAYFYLASRLPPIVTGVSVMFTPVVGVFSGAWILGENVRPADWFALLAICAAIVMVNLKKS